MFAISPMASSAEEKDWRRPTRSWTLVMQCDETLGKTWEKVSILHVR